MRTFLFCLLAITILTQSTSAEIKVEDYLLFDFESRFQREFDKRPYTLKPTNRKHNRLRTLAGLRLIGNEEQWQFRVRVGGTNMFDENNYNEYYEEDLFVHEVWLQVDQIFDSPFSIQAGRFPVKHGRGRILGYNDWSEYGWFTYDGLRVTARGKNWELSLFGAKVWDREVMYRGFRGIRTDGWVGIQPWSIDKEIYGLTGYFFKGAFQPLVYIDYDRQRILRTDMSGNELGIATFRPITTGFYSELKDEELSVIGEFYYQYGEKYFKDASAYLLAFESRWDFDSRLKPFIAGFYEVTSGEKTWSQNHDKIFTAPYASTHEFRGFMDNFIEDDLYGFMDIGLKCGISGLRSDLEVQYHYFRYNKEASNFYGENFTFLGHELDFKYRLNICEYFYAEALFCYFEPNEKWIERPDDANTYMHLTLAVQI